MKWTKFKDTIPINKSIYCTDWKSVWVEEARLYSEWMIYAKNSPEFAWAEIPIPEVPKEWHECLDENGNRCFENIHSVLRLKVNSPKGGYTDMPVNFCPFCGYSPKKE